MNEIACLSELRVPQSRMEEISAFDGGRWELSTLPRPHPSCQNKPVKMADCFAERACRRTEVKSLNCHFNLLIGTLSQITQLYQFYWDLTKYIFSFIPTSTALRSLNFNPRVLSDILDFQKVLVKFHTKTLTNPRTCQAGGTWRDLWTANRWIIIQVPYHQLWDLGRRGSEKLFMKFGNE